MIQYQLSSFAIPLNTLFLADIVSFVIISHHLSSFVIICHHLFNAVTPFFMLESAKTHPEKSAGVFFHSQCMSQSPHIGLHSSLKAPGSNWQQHAVFDPRFCFVDLRQRRNMKKPSSAGAFDGCQEDGALVF